MLCREFKTKQKLQQKHCNQTHHSSGIIIIIITITANHCSLFTVQRLWEFYFSPIKHADPIPIRTIRIPIPISSPKLLHSHGNPMGIPPEWEFQFPCIPLIPVSLWLQMSRLQLEQRTGRYVLCGIHHHDTL